MSRRNPAVALLVEMSNGYARGLVDGICAYVRESGPWSIAYCERSRGDGPPHWLGTWQGDGILARVEDERLAEAVVAKGVPAVDLSAVRLLPDLPCIETDDAEIALLAAEHLMERGFRHFGFCGPAGFAWAALRREHFARLLAEAGFSCDAYEPPPVPGGSRDAFWRDPSHLARWIDGLPKPVGIMAAWDGSGFHVLGACRDLGLAVPDQVAVIGVDDDPLLCDLAEPPLSSVATDPRRTGYEAASLLDRMMAGVAVPPGLRVVGPRGISARGSTDGLAIEDRDIARAVRFIRAHACEGINVEDVLEAVPLSRRQMEARFKAILRRTPHEEICRVQLRRVKDLLIGTDLTLAAIADRAGFRHAEYMCVAFKKKVGRPPGEFRARHRIGGT